MIERSVLEVILVLKAVRSLREKREWEGSFF
jgi:hypothetical protein